MKLILFTDFTPTIDNYRGPSSLCFYLFKALKDRGNTIYVISTNANKVNSAMIKRSEDLMGVKYHICERNLINKILISRKTGWLLTPIMGNRYGYLSRYYLTRKIKEEIAAFNPDLICIYPSYLVNVCKQLHKYKTLVIGPDCSPLRNLRTLKDATTYKDGVEKNVLKELKRNIEMDKTLAKCVDGLALVGKKDTETFNAISRSHKAFFLPHPHYSVYDKEINFNHEKLSVVITGAYDNATRSDVDKMVEVILEGSKNLDNYKFTFIGKGWDEITKRLGGLVDVEHITWVDVYGEELIKHDIQIVPISLGVGTKGKSLDAMSNGLLCIGSHCALENIAGENMKDFVQYNNAEDIVDILTDIDEHRDKYEKIATQGRESVLKFHHSSIGATLVENFVHGRSFHVNSKIYND